MSSCSSPRASSSSPERHPFGHFSIDSPGHKVVTDAAVFAFEPFPMDSPADNDAPDAVAAAAAAAAADATTADDADDGPPEEVTFASGRATALSLARSERDAARADSSRRRAIILAFERETDRAASTRRQALNTQAQLRRNRLRSDERDELYQAFHDHFRRPHGTAAYPGFEYPSPYSPYSPTSPPHSPSPMNTPMVSDIAEPPPPPPPPPPPTTTLVGEEEGDTVARAVRAGVGKVPRRSVRAVDGVRVEVDGVARARRGEAARRDVADAAAREFIREHFGPRRLPRVRAADTVGRRKCHPVRIRR